MSSKYMKRKVSFLLFFFALLFVTFFSLVKAKSILAVGGPSDPELIPIKVMVVAYDPIMENVTGSPRLHAWYGGVDPATATTAIIDDMNAASGGRLRYELVEIDVRDEWPIHVDGTRFTDETYKAAYENPNFKWGDLPNGDLNAIARDLLFEQKVNNGDVEEVWLWGAPGFAWPEATMGGNGAFSLNGANERTVPGVDSPVFPVMGFSHERQIDTAIENFGHRMETLIRRNYDGWNTTTGIEHDWDAFTALNRHTLGQGGVGNIHVAFNGPTGVDYSRESTAIKSTNYQDWATFPYLYGVRSDNNCTLWGCTDYGYVKWWFQNIPILAGTHSNYANNWWRYFQDLEQYKHESSFSKVEISTSDYAENNASSWTCSATCTNDTGIKKWGSSSVKMATTSGEDTYMRYPAGMNANWNLSSYGMLSFWMYSDNTNTPGRFQGPMEVYLKDSSGNGYLYVSPEPSEYDNNANLNYSIGGWTKFDIPLGGNGGWKRTTLGTANFGNIDYVEVHLDTFGSGFTARVDALGFVKDYTEDSDWSCVNCSSPGPSFPGSDKKEGIVLQTMYADPAVAAYMKYPGGGNANWNVNNKKLVFWAFSDNSDSGFTNSPRVKLRTGSTNNYYEYTPTTSSLFDSSKLRWQRFEIPVTGDSEWVRTSTGSPDLTDIDSLEIHPDSLGTSMYSVFFDGVRFEKRDAENPTAVIDSPTGGSVINGIVTVKATGTDGTAMKRMDLLVDGNFVLTDALPPYIFKWDSSVSAQGNHTLTVKSYDMADRSTTSTGVTVNVLSPAQVIFADGFESGDTSAWTNEVDPDNDLLVNGNVALYGSFGLKARIDDTNSMYVAKTFTDKSRFRARFYFDPNSLTMPTATGFIISQGRDASGVSYQVELGYTTASGYRVRTQVYNDAQVLAVGSWVNISDNPHFVEIDWKAADTGTTNGYLSLWVDGVAQGSQTGIDNDTRVVNEVRLGAVAGIEAGTGGTNKELRLDKFESRSSISVGP